MKIETYETAFDLIADTPEEAAHMRARADLMIQVQEIIERNGWTQQEAARRCGVSQPRVNALLRGHFHKFSLDALVKMAAALGQRITIELTDRNAA
ncbi:MAG: XRE family transcriptional regulator [Thalassobaculum sp.]|uniref:helix-turn-helix domain-containing protein n=1 Tax=Thalassobaculum sp. TaxID=2022740 RepID=UPI0032EB647C